MLRAGLYWEFFSFFPVSLLEPREQRSVKRRRRVGCTIWVIKSLIVSKTVVLHEMVMVLIKE